MHETTTNITELLDTTWLTLCAALVLVMQGGFCCLETGLVRSKNSINVAIKNLMDFCLATVIYFTFGFAIMFGASQNGWFGTTGYFLDGITGPSLLAFFLFQAVFCAATTTIVSGAVAERMSFSGYVLVLTIVAGLIYPFIGHWVWAGAESGQVLGWLGKLGFIDFAGATVVHSVGGWSALAAAIVVGPRLGRFGKDASKLHGHNLPLAVLGVVLLWFGWIGFNGGSSLKLTDQIPLIVLNTCLSATFGGAVALACSWLFCARSDVVHAMNGIIAGLVAITASCNIVSPTTAVLVGSISAVVCFAASVLLDRLEVDDVISAFPAHACAGIWGTLAVALFGDSSAFGEGVSRWDQLAIQTTGIAVCFAWSFGVSFALFFLIDRLFYRLRVSEEDERIGLNVAEHQASTEMLDLLSEIEAHQAKDEEDPFENEESEELVAADHHTEVGQIASLYNRMAGMASREREAAKLVRRSEQKIRTIIDSANDGFVAIDCNGSVQRWNAAAERILGFSHDEVLGRHIAELVLPEQDRRTNDLVALLLECAEQGTRIELQACNRDGREFPVEVSASLAIQESEKTINFFLQDITSRKELQHQLAQAQKLESIGQLAAGIAHEINTPVQFIGDNTNFLKQAFEDLQRVISAFEELLDAEKQDANTKPIIQKLDLLIDEVDLSYLQRDIPVSIQHSMHGVARVGHIVRAMKQFSHPGGATKECVDLNQAIEGTITVSQNEWKYVADLIRDYDDNLPPVPCFPNEFNQVVLNMIVNSAHAIQEKLGPHPPERGKIIISTRASKHRVEVRITDTGPGIPDEIKKKVFDPFFTTKEVGRGTGQGLAIAYKAIVDKHQGTLDFESKLGVGTTFVITLPLKDGADARDKPNVVASTDATASPAKVSARSEAVAETAPSPTSPAPLQNPRVNKPSIPQLFEQGASSQKKIPQRAAKPQGGAKDVASPPSQLTRPKPASQRPTKPKPSAPRTREAGRPQIPVLFEPTHQATPNSQQQT